MSLGIDDEAVRGSIAEALLGRGAEAVAAAWGELNRGRGSDSSGGSAPAHSSVTRMSANSDPNQPVVGRE